jgi:hypothetical protein
MGTASLSIFIHQLGMQPSALDKTLGAYPVSPSY